MQALALVFGTRPEIIKLAPVIYAARDAGRDVLLFHTNQHYDHALDAVFFEELGLPPVTANLGVGSGTQAEQLAKALVALEPLCLEHNPSHVIVQGDTNAVLAGALVASKLHIPVAHVEAGLRSHDRTMPEEVNRIITDHVSSVLFPPTEDCRQNLLAEGISADLIHVVGNTIVDAVAIAKDRARALNVLSSLELSPKHYLLATLHRPSNVDTEEALRACLTLIDQVATAAQMPAVLPIHPRTKHKLEQFSLQIPSSIRIIEPQGYLSMISLIEQARCVLTDSGGIQEESCILQTPCLTLRDTTERPETVEVGASILVHHNSALALEAFSRIPATGGWLNPFGDGSSGKQIVSLLAQ